MSKDRKWSPPPLDDEVIDLLRDDPELLAIADALRATRPSAGVRRRPIMVAAALVAALVGVVIAAGAILISSSASLEDRALAAVGERPLFRIVLERTISNDRVIGVPGGKTRISSVRVMAVADDGSGELRVHVAHNGVAVSDAAASEGVPGEAAGVDTLLANFARSYRPALRHGGLATHRSDGVSAVVLSNGVIVELGASAAPLQISGRGSWRVLEAGSTANRRLLIPIVKDSSVVRGDVASRTALPLGAAKSELKGEARIPSVVDGTLVQAFRERLRSETSYGKTIDSVGLRLEFSRGSDRLIVSEALAPQAAYGFAQGRYTFDFNPIPSGAVDIHGRSGESWIGQMRVGRLYLAIRARNEALVLAAARSLTR